MPHTEIQRCPTCGQNVGKRKVFFDTKMLGMTVKMFNRAVRTGSQTVMIRDLQLTHTEYCNLNKLVNFGMAYKEKSMKPGEYGVPKRRIAAFLSGQYTVAQFFVRDCTNDTNQMAPDRIRIDQVPKFETIRDLYGDTLSEYLRNERFESASVLA